MATSSHKARVLWRAMSFSPKVSSATVTTSSEMLDVTTLADDAKRFIPGLREATFNMEGFVDAAVMTELVVAYDILEAIGTTPIPVTYGPSGFGLGAPTVVLPCRRASIEEGTAVNGAANFSLQAQVDGLFGVGGISLHDLTAETSDTNHSSVDRGITSSANGAVANLHVTAYSGLTNIVVTIEDSANNTDFSTIGTFATTTAEAADRITISGTVRRYLRAVTNVTGSGSATYHCSIAPL